MEALAFVEVVDRHKDVLARYPVYRWPARVGRGYQADVILDDPFVAALHLAIEPAAPGRFTVSDLGTVNSISVSPSRRGVRSAEVGPDDLVRVGHTQIRIRTPFDTVPPERPLRATALYRRPVAFMVMASLMIALFAWCGWIVTIEEDDKYAALLIAVGAIVAVGVWISIWSFVSSAVGRRPNFAAHGFVACAGVIALVAVHALFDYLSFGLDAVWLRYVDIAAVATTLAYVVYRHLRLNSRATRRDLFLASAALSIVFSGTVVAMKAAVELSDPGKMVHGVSIKAPPFLFVPGVSPELFVSDAEALKLKVEAMTNAAKK